MMLLPGVCGAFTFVDVQSSSGIGYDQNNDGYTFQQMIKSGGAAPGDYDGDGWVDVYVARLHDSNILYRNMGDGTFDDVTTAAFGADHLDGWRSNGCAWADIDNDGDLDLYVTQLNASRYHLYINNGAGGFTEEAVARGVDVSGTGPNFGYSVAFGDYDLDGYLDFHVTEWRRNSDNDDDHPQNNRLFHNRGAVQPGYFDDVTVAAGVATDGVMNGSSTLDSTGYAPRFSDIDRDGWPDLLLASDSSRSRLFWNDGDGTFTDGTVAAGVGTDKNGMGSALGDYDGDGDLDWLVTSIYDHVVPAAFPGNRLYRYDGGRTFTEQQDQSGVTNGEWGWGAAFCDFDHDGDLDLIQTNGVPDSFTPNIFAAKFGSDETRLWENDGSGSFTDVAGPGSGVEDDDEGKGLFVFDYDRDGDMDVFIVNTSKKADVYRNDGATGDWLQVVPEGRMSNRQGIGAFVSVDRGGAAPLLVREMSGGSNFLGHDEYLMHFGLGMLVGGTIDSVVIEWPSGVSQTLTDVPKNMVLRPVEPDLVVVMVPDGAGGYDLSWNSCEGWSYDVESCADLTAPVPVWTKVGATVDATGTASMANVPSAGAGGFFRVVAMP